MPSILKMTDYNTALGVSQMKSYERMITRRKSTFESLKSQLLRSNHISLVRAENAEWTSLYAFPILVETSAKDVINYATDQGIQAIYAFSSSIVACDEKSEQENPSARALSQRCILFPLHQRLSDEDIRHVGKVLATLP